MRVRVRGVEIRLRSLVAVHDADRIVTKKEVPLLPQSRLAVDQWRVVRDERLDVLGVLLVPDIKLHRQVGWPVAVRLLQL